MNLSEYLLCCLNILVSKQICRGPSACRQTDSESRLLLYGCYQTAHHDFSRLTARYLHTSPPVAMVIETGVSSDRPTTDIRAALKQKHQTAAGGGDLLSPVFKVHLNHNKPISMQRIEYIKPVEEALSLFIMVFILHSSMHERLNERTNNNLNKRYWSVPKIKLAILFGAYRVYAESEP